MKNLKVNPQRLKSEVGATIVELSLVILIVVVFLVAIIDFGRYLTYQAILNGSCGYAAEFASKQNQLTNDFRSISSPPVTDIQGFADFQSRRQDFVRALRRVQQAALSVPYATILNQSTTAPSELGMSTFLNIFELANSSDNIAAQSYFNPVRTSNVSVILPGFSVTQTKYAAGSPNGVTTIVEHPTCKNIANCPNLGIPGKEYWFGILRSHPVCVQSSAQLKLLSFQLLFGNGDVTVNGSACTYLEIAPGELIQAPPPGIPVSPTGGNQTCSNFYPSGCAQAPWCQLGCTFAPNNQFPVNGQQNCFTCLEQKCSNIFPGGEAEFCSNPSYRCPNYQTCNFRATLDVTTRSECGTCAPKKCRDWTTQQDYCANPGCPTGNGKLYRCEFNGDNDAPNCGNKCVPLSCGDVYPGGVGGPSSLCHDWCPGDPYCGGCGCWEYSAPINQEQLGCAYCHNIIGRCGDLFTGAADFDSQITKCSQRYNTIPNFHPYEALPTWNPNEYVYGFIGNTYRQFETDKCGVCIPRSCGVAWNANDAEIYANCNPNKHFVFKPNNGTEYGPDFCFECVINNLSSSSSSGSPSSSSGNSNSSSSSGGRNP